MRMLKALESQTVDSEILEKICKAKRNVRFAMMDEIRPGWDKELTENAGRS